MRLPGSSVTDIPVPDDMILKKSHSPQLGYSILTPFLKNQGRTIDRVLGDGNCLFRALSLQLTGLQDHHMDLRRIIAQCESKIKSFQGIHASINRTNYADHLKNIKKTCTWGTNLEIIVTATLFGLDVYVASDSYNTGKPTWLKYPPNMMATTELHNSSERNLSSTFPLRTEINGWNLHMFQDATLMPSSQLLLVLISCADQCCQALSLLKQLNFSETFLTLLLIIF